MNWSISKKLIIITLLAILLPAIIGNIVLYKEIAANVGYTKLNDLMNIIDARYIHLLDFLKQQKLAAETLAENQFIHENIDRYYDHEGIFSEGEKNKALKNIHDYLSHLREDSQLDWHAMKIEKEQGISLQKVFGREVKWDMFRLDERLYRYAQIFIIDPDGKVISSSNGDDIGADMKDTDLFKYGRREIFIKDVYEDHAGNNTMAFAAPLSHEGDYIEQDHFKFGSLGVVVLKIGTDFLTDLVTGDLGNQIGGKLFFAGYTPSTDFYLINKEGYMITQSKALMGQRDTILKQESRTLPWQRCIDEGLAVREAQEFYLNYAGVEVGGASMCVFDMKWTIVVEQDRDEILALFTSIKKIMTIVGLAMAAAAILLLFLLIRKVVILPINQLSNATRQLTRGDYNARVEISHNDEIGQLGKSFNSMVEDIEKSTHALQANNQQLEERIESRTEELRCARDAAEAANETKSQFLANMSHEIRTPLTAVLGMAKIGMRDCKDSKDKGTFNHIFNSGRHLLRVINDILDFSKFEAGKLTIETCPFQLISTVEDSVNMLRERAQGKGLKLTVDLPSSLPEWVLGDPHRLQQILLNLVSNSIKFTAEGEVLVSVSRVGNMIYFKVTDTGIGLNEEQVSRLFTPFEQADTSTTRKFGGTGLGLTISINLARLMNGKINVESRVGEGSTFTLCLPLIEADPPRQLETVGAGTHGTQLEGIRILAAEDVEINRMILEDMLESEGAHVIFAENGQEALDHLEERGVTAFDMVLMDLQMPVMDGYRATRLILEIAPTLPVIGLTAHALEEEQRKCFEVGMVEHVTKPIDPDTLISAIRRHVEIL